MTLSDVEIWAEIGAGRLVLDPSPNGDRIGNSSIDLLLHDELLILPSREKVESMGITINPSAPEMQVMSLLSELGERINLPDSGPYTMEPNHLVIGKTFEYLKLPTHLAARIEGKSSLARLGLSVHITAPTIQAGWEGRIYLEMNNVGPFDIQLSPKMEIAQLIIEHVGLPTRGKSEGRFWGQR